MASVKVPLTKEIIDQIQRQYADLIVADIRRINDPNNLAEVPKIVSEIQNKLNDFAKHLFDKYGRIIIRVGGGDFDYLDITSPRIKVCETKAMIYFLETDRKGKPAHNPTALEG
jgi:hypothetical protein